MLRYRRDDQLEPGRNRTPDWLRAQRSEFRPPEWFRLRQKQHPELQLLWGHPVGHGMGPLNEHFAAACVRHGASPAATRSAGLFDASPTHLFAAITGSSARTDARPWGRLPLAVVSG